MKKKINSKQKTFKFTPPRNFGLYDFMKKINKGVQVADVQINESGVHVRYEGVKEFWTKREYDYQDLIINGIVVHREIPGQAIRTIPFARVDIYYDSPEGLGRKGINGVEFKVYKEARKFLDFGELDLLNDKWRTAKYEGKYTFHDPMSRVPIYDKDIPKWIKKSDFKVLKKKEPKKILDKEIQKAISESFYLPKEPVKDSPLQDLFLTKNIDPKDVVGDGNLSTLYKHIKGDRELSKDKAEEYAKTLGVAPASLMFEPKTINVWSNVKLSGKIETPDGSVAILPGECYEKLRTEVTVCPSDIYRLDLKAIRINDPNAIYDGFIAYYYDTDKVSEAANNKLCMIRTINKGKTLLGGYYKYYLGIFQIFGTKKIILNPDPTSENKIIASDIEPDVVAPIISFTKPSAILADKVLSKNIKQVQQLGELIRKEEKEKNKLKEIGLEKQNKQMLQLQKQIEAQLQATEAEVRLILDKLQVEADKKAAIKKSFLGNLFTKDDDVIIPEFIKKENAKKRA
tara:strand:+ start:157 stop:1698 length:1542 start_codon:yes stop_codon:yes gene_type:complete